MSEAADIITRLKAEGFRITPARTLLIKFLAESTEPISAIDLIESFKESEKNVNKTTIYRELDFLLERKLIQEIEFGDGRKRYELETGHHHHLVCLNCKKVLDIGLDVDLHLEEKKIEKSTGFKIKSHSLEFFGYCKKCKIKFA